MPYSAYSSKILLRFALILTARDTDAVTPFTVPLPHRIAGLGAVHWVPLSGSFVTQALKEPLKLAAIPVYENGVDALGLAVVSVEILVWLILRISQLIPASAIFSAAA